MLTLLSYERSKNADGRTDGQTAFQLYIVDNLLADLLIRQIFFCQMLETSQFAKLSLHTVCTCMHAHVHSYTSRH